jgi:4-hydroxymandelate oxidase
LESIASASHGDELGLPHQGSCSSPGAASQETTLTATSEAAALPLNLHEYEDAARTVLSPMAWHYVAGGSGDEVTLRANRAAFDRWRLLPRVLRGLREVSTVTTVLGQDIALPVLIAPSGRHRLCHDEGERATARAARAAGTIYTMSTAATLTIEEIAPAAGPWWFQLYVYRDRGFTREMVTRAAAAGASALVVTVDVPMRGRREAEERTRFAMPQGVATALLAAPEGTVVPGGATGNPVAAEINAVFDPALHWHDLEWLASLSPMPVLLKGILHPADAVRAIEYGIRAILVSNHGGRQLDSAVAALDALPAVVEAVAGRVEVLVDGGVRRGTDVLKALALGARAVLIGRPIHWGLAVDGEAGVRHVLELLRAELARDLMLCGLASPGEIDRSLIVPAGKC